MICASAQAVAGPRPGVIEEAVGRQGPVDRGTGTGGADAVRVPARTGNEAIAPAAAVVPATGSAAVPAGGPDAHVKGAFGQPAGWALNALQGAILPDGRVLTYGVPEAGNLIYDVWDPALGTGDDAHMTLPNTTATNIFCSGQSVLPTSGEVLLVGGSVTIDGVDNNGIDSTTVFDPDDNSLAAGQTPMAFKRWYPSIIPLANGDKLVVGGRETTTVYTPTPEIFAGDGSWRTPPGASSDAAFGLPSNNWFYPRGYQMPNDPSKVFFIGFDGVTYLLTPEGTGSIAALSVKTKPSVPSLPTALFAQGKLLSLRNAGSAVVIDFNGATPVVTPTSSLSQVRHYANATVLADGKVLVNGGSSSGNNLTGAAYDTETWDPATGNWTMGATAQKPRLYHSNALLLPDASVLTMGGGNPGPVRNLNAEIYYPPYLYDTDGNPARRPMLLGAPAILGLIDRRRSWFTATVGASDRIARVTLLHAGAATHDNNLEQNFQELRFRQLRRTLVIDAPANPTYTLPGYYLLFAFNDLGVPSQARIIKISTPSSRQASRSVARARGF